MRPNLLPDNAVCRRCGETGSSALVANDDGVICLNCLALSRPYPKMALCTICGKVLPIEIHHIASRALYPRLTAPLCLNCHSVLYSRQYSWRRSGRAEKESQTFVLVGIRDLFKLIMERGSL